jgi:5-methylcytosine-specific restriction endonuclease McrA
METFSIIEPVELPPELNHQLDEFQNDEVRKFYVRQRRKHCTFMQIMDLWLVVPICYGCALDESCDGIVRPYIESRNWRDAIQDHAGLAVLRRTSRELQLDPDFAYICKKCGTRLRPWNGDQMSVSHLHLEEHFNIPLETPGRRNPSLAVKKLIEKLYDNRCFGCNRQETTKRKLHIDHILPQSRGGTSAFRNLQPLCDRCGNKKADKMPSEVEVYSTIFFGPYPSDSHEGLFW